MVLIYNPYSAFPSTYTCIPVQWYRHIICALFVHSTWMHGWQWYDVITKADTNLHVSCRAQTRKERERERKETRDSWVLGSEIIYSKTCTSLINGHRFLAFVRYIKYIDPSSTKLFTYYLFIYVRTSENLVIIVLI